MKDEPLQAERQGERSESPAPTHEFVASRMPTQLCVFGSDAHALCGQPRFAPVHTEAPEPERNKPVESSQSALSGLLALLSPEGYFVNDSPAVDKAWRERVVNARKVLEEAL